MDTTSIDILLATYNGQPYLSQQLDSLFGQTFKNWTLYIRDDNSCDLTTQIIRDYQIKYPDRLIWIQDNKGHLGASTNFSTLLQYSKNSYTLFCDQDDVWLQNKIEITFNKMREVEDVCGADTPIITHTDLKVVDENLNIISDSFWNFQRLDHQQGLCLNRLLVQNVVTGCTVMINKALKNKLHRMPRQTLMYDWWIALTAAALGKIDYVPIATVLYRQHDKNGIGAKKWGPDHILKTASLGTAGLRTLLEKTQLQAAAFLDVFGSELTAQSRELLTVYASIGQMNYLMKRLCMIKYGFYKTGFLRNLGMLLSL